jgi:hypothetical protein
MEGIKEVAMSEAGSNVMLKLILTLIPAISGAGLLIGLSSYKKTLGSSYMPIYWIFIPLLIYGITTVCCIIAQYVSCNTINATTVMNTTWQIMIYIFFALGLGEITMMRAPVVSLVPFEGLKGINDILTIEGLRPGIRERAVGYWVFWLTLFGQMAIIGKTTICKSGLPS